MKDNPWPRDPQTQIRQLERTCAQLRAEWAELVRALEEIRDFKEMSGRASTWMRCRARDALAKHGGQA